MKDIIILFVFAFLGFVSVVILMAFGYISVGFYACLATMAVIFGYLYIKTEV